MATLLRSISKKAIPQCRRDAVVACVQIIEWRPIVVYNVGSGTDNNIAAVIGKQTALTIQLLSRRGHTYHRF